VKAHGGKDDSYNKPAIMANVSARIVVHCLDISGLNDLNVTSPVDLAFVYRFAFALEVIGFLFSNIVNCTIIFLFLNVNDN
jgi:hypothetical protein